MFVAVVLVVGMALGCLKYWPVMVVLYRLRSFLFGNNSKICIKAKLSGTHAEKRCSLRQWWYLELFCIQL